MAQPRDFEFSAGAPSLDFADTLAERETLELLDSPAALDRWRRRAGFDFPMRAPSEAELVAAVRLRDAIRRAARAAIWGEASADEVATINAFALAAPPRPQLVDGELRLTAATGIEGVLSALAEDALRHLTAERRGRLRACVECDMLFFDNSPPGRRRWCSSSAGCGNRAKVRRHRELHRRAAS